MRLAMMFVAICLATQPVAAETPTGAAINLYERFVAAQNGRDLDRVRDLLDEAQTFLWVSDGQSYWGRDVMVDRMASFQQADTWHVTPDLAKARVVEISPEASFLHLPLELAIGDAKAPDRLQFLVSVLCRRTTTGWRISALFTTREKKP